jgi:hypothetical protein
MPAPALGGGLKAQDSPAPPLDLDGSLDPTTAATSTVATKKRARVKPQEFNSSDVAIMREFRKELLNYAAGKRVNNTADLKRFINKNFFNSDNLKYSKFEDMKKLFITSVIPTKDGKTIKDRLEVIDTIARYLGLQRDPYLPTDQK